MVGRKLFVKVVFVVGLLICSYPLISNLIESYYQKDAIATYSESVKKTDAKALEEEYKKGEEYNTTLYSHKTSKIVNKVSNTDMLSEDSYNSLVNMGNGIIGSIEIPKINVNLPIYHGTSDEVLSVGVGHVYGSSLPLGGTNTRSVLTGHRGLPNAKLFTRLDEVVEGDLFFIRVLNKTLAYKISDIVVIKPEDVDSVDIVEGKDLVSLITCTPYGINTHRLVVTGERVPFVESEYKAIESQSMSLREILFASIPVIFIGVVVATKVRGKIKNRKKGEKEKDENK
ncbi:class C sortase [Clostridium baratii]